MLSGLLGGLLLAWLLTLFSFDVMVIDTFMNLFQITLNINSYYCLFAFIGLIGGVIRNRNE